MAIKCSCLLLLLLLIIKTNSHRQAGDCFCQLSGKIIEECDCKVETIDSFNNIKIYPRIVSLIRKNYFRYFKVNLKKKCPFWSEDSKCAMETCQIQPCWDIPDGIKQPKCEQSQLDLANVNMTISSKIVGEFPVWEAQFDHFCVHFDDDSDVDAVYVDLIANPERFTGYEGGSAQRIWHAIYGENCFRPGLNQKIYTKPSGLCLEEKVYFMAISGLHTSINIHLCANYLLSKSTLYMASDVWGPNLDEFQRRFTNTREGPQWLKNLYFLYLLELKALAKASYYLKMTDFFTGNAEDDFDTRMAVRDLLKIIENFPGEHFDEGLLFLDGKIRKNQFREHFQNVTKIMDCVGCEKCKLWGKLQIRGMGVALQILFGDDIHLQRDDIVALFNAFARLATSIYKLDDFRTMLANG